MNNQTILAVILTIIAIINYGVIIFIWKHPENISGFKWGTKDEEKLEDRKWIGLLVKSLLYANTAMFIGGLVSVFSNSDVLLYTFVCFPIPLAVCYAYCRRKTDDGRSRIKTALIAGTIIALLSVPLLYSQYSDLEVTFGKEHIEINGLYGETINYADIMSISIERQAPDTKKRTNGFALGHTRLGHFITENNEQATLFTHSDSCCIRIVNNNGNTIYLNHKTASKTLTTYEMLTHKSGTINSR